MLTDQLTDEELQLAARALSIHRVQMRRKLMKLTPGEPSFASTLREIRETQALVSKLNGIDLDRLAS
jgi:hypothetical protein